MLSPKFHSPPAAAGVKRAKGHTDAPTPNPSPDKRRIYKRASNSAIRPPPPHIFSPVSPPSRRRGPADCVWSSKLPARAQLNTTLRNQSQTRMMKGRGSLVPSNEFSWGPEDDAPLAPRVPIDAVSICGTPSNTYFEWEALSQGRLMARGTPTPPLEEVDEQPSDTDDEDPAPPPQPSASSQSRAAPKPKITGYFKVETLEERAVRLERESREYAEHAEEARLREVDAKGKIAARKRADALSACNASVLKRVELVEVDEAASATDITMAELSRP
ncbi:hypothetical protein B0H14DRAFT_3436415 [Mycena olivaceomarginata]|nr:hypothetical protein B0H14DRAFT_3436415 [Mycena olivaceomarginata]